ncbi:MAG: enoyl-[acyl-carrier-protein] reductase FabK [Cellulosilyticum sp.]|nr:enoyl-[acyl-carrier-protein] reductase FabK [Cellulosilyticum sp.]
MKTICELLNISYPIFQGGMAWVATHSIAAAVSNAGGLGIIAAGHAPADWVREEIRACKKKTDKPFGVNVMLLSPYVDEVMQVILEEKVAVVTTGAGNPGKYIEALKAAGVKVIPVVPSVALAKRMERCQVDAVIAEGCESGGHIGELTTMVLVPQVVDAVNIPVIAAGGIADGRGMAAAFMLGACGVQIGTRFLVAKECDIPESYKERVIKASDIDAVVTGRSTGHPVRCLRNQLTRALQKLEKAGASEEEFNKLGTGALRRAVIEGDMQNGSVLAGQIAGMITREQTTEEIIQELMRGVKESFNLQVEGINV